MNQTNKIVILDGNTVNPGDLDWKPIERFGQCDVYPRTPPEKTYERSKDADIIILDGHPFHHNTFVETTIVNGKVLYEKHKSSFFSHIKHSN